jgi:trehalose 6-phosphate phosphatase
VRSFLRSRHIVIEDGEPSDPPDRETVCGLGNRKDGYFERDLATHGVQTYEGTIGLIRQLKEQGFKVAVVSASKHCAAILEAASIVALFDARVDGDDAERLGLAGKPAPATYLEATRRLEVPPGRAAVVEDAIAGVQAGCAGGFGLVIGVNRSSAHGALLENGADVEVRDLSEVSVAP